MLQFFAVTRAWDGALVCLHPEFKTAWGACQSGRRLLGHLLAPPGDKHLELWLHFRIDGNWQGQGKWGHLRDAARLVVPGFAELDQVLPEVFCQQQPQLGLLCSAIDHLQGWKLSRAKSCSTERFPKPFKFNEMGIILEP